MAAPNRNSRHRRSGRRAARSVALGLALTLGATTDALAGPIFSVDRMFGGEVRLAGTVETDGTLGPLSAANLVDWNLNLSDTNLGYSITFYRGPTVLLVLPGQPILLNSTAFVAGAGLSATGAGLFFDFSSLPDVLFSITSSTVLTCPGNAQLTPDWSLGAAQPVQNAQAVEVTRLETIGKIQCPIPGQISLPFHALASHSEPAQIATVVPETSSLPLLGLGLAGIGFARGRARRARNAALAIVGSPIGAPGNHPAASIVLCIAGTHRATDACRSEGLSSGGSFVCVGGWTRETDSDQASAERRRRRIPAPASVETRISTPIVSMAGTAGGGVRTLS